ncbi:putative F-box/LRR-repeat protein 23 [Rutidosis leptorrhynchoides]|uniref:putative F-box/LRR-repeat protein 23 n=1 Tax=Rutidosis leptorrhynchoides TaxID=125765 RepID=UPI003A98CF49
MMSSTTDWFNLPFELKFKILDRVGRRDILVNAQNVCTDWYKVFKDPLMWRSINLSRFSLYDDSPPNIAKHAVDRSQGQLVNVVISTFKIIELLRYVADRSSQLRRLEVLFMFGEYVNKALAEALVKFPLLEVLVVSTKYFSSTVIKNAGRYCPSLQKLVVNRTFYVSKSRVRLNNRIAIAIGENLHELRHLKLECNGISNIGLKVVMDGCRHLKSLK